MFDCTPFHFRACYIDYWLWATVPGLFLPVGVVGNTLNIIILSRKRIRKFSTSVYLMFLAVSDMLFMMSSCLAETVHEMTGKRLEVTSNFMCKTNNWIVHTSAGFSVWLLVLLTIERVLLTKWPYVAKARLSSRNALKASLVTAVVCALFPVHYFFGFEIRLAINHINQTRNTCQPLPGEYYLFDQYPWKVMILVVLNIIPMCLITAGNLAILATIVKQKRSPYETETS
ncbi:C-C chemokine receptor type 3-like [Dreissena polymorpha]|uniref:C-C chemokine receptor type 3-like n=1 Tax=Dreissena polymorpha TaxID=45954 RepID=UPI002263EB7F|nr:C-C chemokine receptor type 3-like [Dreissena polymorpha]